MSLKFVVAGLLLDRQMHGYEIKRSISPMLPPGQLINDGVLYPLLRRMEKDGLIEGRAERVGKAPSRRVFKTTKKGSDEFKTWLRSDDPDAAKVAYDFMIGDQLTAKAFFLSRLTAGHAKHQLEYQLEAATMKLREYGRVRKELLRRGFDAQRIAVLDLEIALQRTRVHWLKKRLTTTAGDRAAKSAA